MRARSKPWSRSLWGVEWVTPDSLPKYRAVLLGSLWHDVARNESYRGEPTRALVFCNRREARAWCAEKNAKYKSLPEGAYGRNHRMRVVRVRETVKVVS